MGISEKIAQTFHPKTTSKVESRCRILLSNNTEILMQVKITLKVEGVSKGLTNLEIIFIFGNMSFG